MTKFDPAERFTPEAVHKFEADAKDRNPPSSLSKVALQVASQYRRDTTSPVMVSGVLRLVELALLIASGLILFSFHVGLGTHLVWQYPLIIVSLSILTIVGFELADCYQVPALMRPISTIGRTVLIWGGAFALLAVAGFFMKASGDFSRLLFGLWFAMGLVLIFGLRFVSARVIRKWARNGKMERRALIVGGGKAAESLIRSVEQQPYNDIRICGIFDDRDDKRSPPIVAGYPKLGTISALIEFARVARIDLAEMNTKEIIEIPNAAGNHASPFVTQGTEYVVTATRFSVPMPQQDVPIST